MNENDFIFYMLAKERTATARQRYEAAAAALALAEIRERMAEIKSQHEPLAKLAESGKSARNIMCAAASYVVNGRIEKT